MSLIASCECCLVQQHATIDGRCFLWCASANLTPTFAFYFVCYTTTTESEILIRHADRHQDLDLQKSNSREELQRNILVRMQSVTKANESVCIALLEDNNYDLKTSVEAFFQPR